VVMLALGWAVIGERDEARGRTMQSFFRQGAQ
jgi:hypothetical protein